MRIRSDWDDETLAEQVELSHYDVADARRQLAIALDVHSQMVEQQENRALAEAGLTVTGGTYA